MIYGLLINSTVRFVCGRWPIHKKEFGMKKNKVLAASTLKLLLVVGLALVFGMAVAGCTLMQAMNADYQAKQTDGKGGSLRVENTSKVKYWCTNPIPHYSRTDNDLVFFIREIMPNNMTSFPFDADGTYTVRYRQQFDGENKSHLNAEQIKMWSSKSIYVSGDETITITIP